MRGLIIKDTIKSEKRIYCPLTKEGVRICHNFYLGFNKEPRLLIKTILEKDLFT
jgi:hypothetical protein